MISMAISACDNQNSPNNTTSQSNNSPVNQDIKLETAADKASYSIGYNFASDIKRSGFDDINLKAFNAGTSDGLDDKQARVTQEEEMQAFNELQKQMEEKIAKEREKNEKAGKEFLAENAKREGVTTTKSGLQYEIITKSENGKKPELGDIVEVHYEGKLIDGTVFDSSIARGEPVTFPLNAVIEGWKEGLQLMQTGDKFKLFIPANLAYGENSPGEKIPANSTLIFEVELLSIKDNPGESTSSAENTGKELSELPQNQNKQK